jgi:hypothetical protein
MHTPPAAQLFTDTSRDHPASTQREQIPAQCMAEIFVVRDPHHYNGEEREMLRRQLWQNETYDRIMHNRWRFDAKAACGANNA